MRRECQRKGKRGTTDQRGWECCYCRQSPAPTTMLCPPQLICSNSSFNSTVSMRLVCQDKELRGHSLQCSLHLFRLMSQISSFERKRMEHLNSLWLWTRAFWEFCSPPGTILEVMAAANRVPCHDSWLNSRYKNTKQRKPTACTSGTAIRDETVVEFIWSRSLLGSRWDQ